MNILTGIHLAENTSAVAVFYTSFSYSTDPKIITKAPQKGARKCEMFKRSYVVNAKLFENGITFKFQEPSTKLNPLQQNSYRSFKVHLHPQRLKDQVYTLADLLTKCGHSGLIVVEFFSKVIADIDMNEFKETG